VSPITVSLHRNCWTTALDVGWALALRLGLGPRDDAPVLVRRLDPAAVRRGHLERRARARRGAARPAAARAPGHGDATLEREGEALLRATQPAAKAHRVAVDDR